MFKLDRYGGRFNALNDFPNKICVSNNTEDLNPSVLNVVIGINESKMLNISCKCKCRCYEKKYNSDQCWNNGKSQCEFKKRYACEKDYFGIMLHIVVKKENI